MDYKDSINKFSKLFNEETGPNPEVIKTIKKLLANEWVDECDINKGNCEEFAIDVMEAMGVGDVVWLEDLFKEYPELKDVAHAVYELDGWYYDSDQSRR